MKRILPVAMAAMLPVAFVTGYVAKGGSSTVVPERRTETPSETSVEAGFSRDMSTHHSQAVDMAERIRTRSTDTVLRTLATDIVLTQQNQIGQFRGWLEQWGLPTASTGTPMSWMIGTDSKPAEINNSETDGSSPTTQHDMTEMNNKTDTNQASAMAGMASRADVNALSTLGVADAERSFLQLMIRHHEGGVAMADAVLTRTERPEVLRLAKLIAASQIGEITAMQQLLATRKTGQT